MLQTSNFPSGPMTQARAPRSKRRQVLNAVIIEDDSDASELLSELLSRLTPPIAIAGRADTIESARVLLLEAEYDVAFLDIHLPGGDGFDLVGDVRPDAAMIFVTGRADEAARAFEVNAVDYIVKPVTAARLAQALRRLGHSPAEDRGAPTKLRASDRVFLRGAAGAGRFTPLSEINAILSSENYSEVLLADGERWFIRRTLQAWEESLPPEIFQRVHRTAIVNLGAIERIERNDSEQTTLKLRSVRQPIAVSRRVWQQLRIQLADRSIP
jgi:two-component system, LytTR family, response regulator